jgi:hypothetical protein
LSEPEPPATDRETVITLPVPLEPPVAAPAVVSPQAGAKPLVPDVEVDPVDAFMQEALAELPETADKLSVAMLQEPPPSIEQELAAWVADRPNSQSGLSSPAMLDSEPEEPDFVQEARRKAFSQRPLVRFFMVMAGLALVAVLAGQWIVHDRDRIAAFEPRARPLIDWLCQRAGCTIAPLKQIDAIVIDSSSFKKDRDNAYHLNLVIKSSATVAIAMPSVELTLTDAQDQPVLRRVLTPAEMGAAAVMAPLGEWSASLPISVAADNVATRISGYRVIAFYP